ncbi:MAG: hypothetical protein WCG52_07830 [bacterium]
MKSFCFIVLCLTVTLRANDFNAIVLEQVHAMPSGGGYATTRSAHDALLETSSITPEGIRIQAEKAHPSYCSGATYLVFLKTLQALQSRGSLRIGTEAWKKLLPARMGDGVGVWGRWNANGPGTARLFHELGLGRNFTSFEEAQPGDFLKIFWSDAVGKNERGHSVIFLGLENKDGVEHVRFWSSNKPNGFGEKSVPKSKVSRALFSRLETPSNLNQLDTLPARDKYLASLLSVDSSIGEVRKMTGAR